MNFQKQLSIIKPSWEESAIKFINNGNYNRFRSNIKIEEEPAHRQPYRKPNICQPQNHQKSKIADLPSATQESIIEKRRRGRPLKQNQQKNIPQPQQSLKGLSQIEKAFLRNLAESQRQPPASIPSSEKEKQIPKSIQQFHHSSTNKPQSSIPYPLQKYKKASCVIEILSSSDSEKEELISLTPNKFTQHDRKHNHQQYEQIKGQQDIVGTVGNKQNASSPQSPVSKLLSFLQKPADKYQKQGHQKNTRATNDQSGQFIVLSPQKRVPIQISEKLKQNRLLMSQDKAKMDEKNTDKPKNPFQNLSLPAVRSIMAITKAFALKDKLKLIENENHAIINQHSSKLLPQRENFHIPIHLLPSKHNNELRQKQKKIQINKFTNVGNKTKQVENNYHEKNIQIKQNTRENQHNLEDNNESNKDGEGKVWTSTINKYKIGNNHVKYKQERIDNYFNTHRSYPRKKPQPQKQPQKQLFIQTAFIQNDDNSRTAKKTSKYPKEHHPLTIQRQLQSQNVNHSRFLERRAKRPGKPRDVGVLSLDELVEQCFIKEILSQEVYVEYINATTRQKMLDYVKLFMDGKVEEWDYSQLQITLMDHRRLAEVLVKVFPNDFVLFHPEALNKQINEFLTNLYLLPSSDYYVLVNGLDQISGITFWTTFKLKYQSYIKKPLLIFPYVPIYEPQQIRWSDNNSSQSPYTPTEQQMIDNYKGIREKPKQPTKLPIYIDCEDSNNVLPSFSSSSSSTSSLSSEVPYDPSLSNHKHTVKKSGKNEKWQQRHH